MLLFCEFVDEYDWWVVVVFDVVDVVVVDVDEVVFGWKCVGYVLGYVSGK